MQDEQVNTIKPGLFGIRVGLGGSFLSEAHISG